MPIVVGAVHVHDSPECSALMAAPSGNKADDNMTLADRRPRRGAATTLRRRTTSAIAAVTLTGAALVLPQAMGMPAAAADPPAVADPGVLPEVDLDSLVATPVRQWGVVGTGTSNTAPKPHVWDFAEIGNTIYVAGTFTGVQENGDTPATPVYAQPYLAAFDRDTGAWLPTFAPVINATVITLEEAPNGKLLIGGEFTSVNGVARAGLAMLDPVTGATDPTFAASVEGSPTSVREILLVGNQIYIAGQFFYVKVNGTNYWVWNAARLNALTGGIDGSWVPQFSGGLWDLTIDPSRGRVHAVGFFTSVNGQPGTARMATVTEATGASVPGLTPFENNTTGQRDTVAIAYANDRIYVGGAQHILQVLDASTNERIGFSTTGIGCNTFNFDACGTFMAGGDFQVLEVSAGGKIIGGCHCFRSTEGGWNDPSWLGQTHYNSFTGQRTDNRVAIAYNTSDSTPSSTFVPGLKANYYGTWAIHVDANGCYYVGGYYTRTEAGAWLGGFGRFCKAVADPANVAVVAANAGASVSWTAPTSQLPIAYYKVYRNGTFAGDTTSTSYGFSNIATGATTFTVRTVDVTGRMSTGVTVNATVPGADTQAPGIPPSLASSINAPAVTLNWGASSDDQAVKEYVVHRDGVYLGATAANARTFTDPTPSSGNRSYQVRARDFAGNLSDPATLVVTVPGPADTTGPQTPSATGSVSGSTVTLNWGAVTDLPNPGGSGLSGYLIHRDYQFIKFVPGGTLTTTDVGVANGTHRYEIRAVDLNNNYSAPSAPVLLTVGAADTTGPQTPSATGSVSGSTVTLNWGAVTDLPNPGGSGLSGYLIHRDWVFVKFVPAGTLTWDDLGVSSGQHRYEVRGVDLANNYSSPSTPVIVTVP